MNLYNKIIKSISKGLYESKLFNDDLLNTDELTLDELNIADNLVKYVDLGLPSKTLWCSHNIGTYKSEGYGDYLTFDEANKKYKNIPTKRQLNELVDKCIWEWSLLNGVNGYKVTGKNNNSIFLPAGGFILIDDSGMDINKSGCYWSSNISTNSKKPYYIEFRQNFINLAYGKYLNKNIKFTIRQCKKEKK